MKLCWVGILLLIIAGQGVYGGENYKLVFEGREFVIPQPDGYDLDAAHSQSLVAGMVDRNNKTQEKLVVATFHSNESIKRSMEIAVSVKGAFYDCSVEAISDKKEEIELMTGFYYNAADMESLAAIGVDTTKGIIVETGFYPPQTNEITSCCAHSAGSYKDSGAKYDYYQIFSMVWLDGITYTIRYHGPEYGNDGLEKFWTNYINKFYSLNSKRGNSRKSSIGDDVQSVGAASEKVSKLLNSEFKPFSTSGLKNSRGVNLTIEYPAAYEAVRDEYGVAGVFHSPEEKVHYIYAFSIGTYRYPSNEKIRSWSKKLQSEVCQRYFLGTPDDKFLMDSGGTVKRKKAMINGYPAVIIDVHYNEVAQGKVLSNVAKIIAVFCGQDRALFTMECRYDSEKGLNDGITAFDEYEKLFTRMAESIRFSDEE